MSHSVPVHEGPAPAWLDRAIAAAAVGVAAWIVWRLAPIAPDPRGFGTHEALGWTPCSWPTTYGIPCPTCGATTAACLMVHLRPLDALLAHPFGAVLAVLTFVVAALGLHDLLRGRAFLVRAYSIKLAPWVVGGVVLLGASWLYKWLSWR